MLQITLDTQSHNNEYENNSNNEQWFEIKVVDDSLFSEPRLSFSEESVNSKNQIKSKSIKLIELTSETN